jgi:uncharacterized membrane protein YccC
LTPKVSAGGSCRRVLAVQPSCNTKAEEVIFVDGYDEVSSYIPPGETANVEFENRYFNCGISVSQADLDRINAHRKRRGLPLIAFAETEIDDYARLYDKAEKAEHRRRLREELQTLAPEARQKLVDAATAEVSQQPPPHATFEEWRERRERRSEENRRSQEDVAKRVALAKQAEQAAKTATKVTRHLDMLRLTDDPELADEIVAHLSADEALIAAKQINEPRLRVALIRRALQAEV